MVTKSIENAQISVESRNFQARKNTLEYDDVMNKQRTIIYGQRQQVLDGFDIHPLITSMILRTMENKINEVEIDGLSEETCKRLISILPPSFASSLSPTELAKMDHNALSEFLNNKAQSAYLAIEKLLTVPVVRDLERIIMLNTVDEYWMEHIDAMQELRQGIRLRAYAQSNPVDAYKAESLQMFEEMIAAIQEETVYRLFSVRIALNKGIVIQKSA